MLGICALKKKNNKITRRLSLLDTVRGVCILLMIYHHASFLILNTFFSPNFPLYDAAFFINSSLYRVIWLCYVCLFFIIAGICCNFSANNVKRAVKVLLGAAVVSAVTIFVFSSQFIAFGVLHCMGVCMLGFALAKKLKLDRYLFCPWMAAVYAILFFGWYFALGIGVFLPYNEIIPVSYLPVALGFPYRGYVSVDYYPVLPWIFMFSCGVCLGKLIKNRQPSKIFYLNIPPFSFIGRHSLFIYLIHQPVALAVLWIISAITG